MKKHAYLIIAHAVDKTLNTLLELIDDPRNDVFLHMDKKNKSFNKDDLYKFKHSPLYLTDRISVNWGGYSLVCSELILFEAAHAKQNYQYYHLVSGVDLPIKTQDQIHQFFDENNGKEFISFESEVFSGHLYGERIWQYHFFQEFIGRKAFFLGKIEALSVKLQALLGVHRNRDVNFQKGCQWVSVTNAFVSELLRNKEWVERVFKFSFGADELYKHTFAINFGFADKIYISTKENKPSSMRLIDWTRGRPYLWKESDWDIIMHSDKLFARKFNDSEYGIVDHIKRHLLG